MARKVDVEYIQFYTDGSAARKLEPKKPRPAQKPRVSRQKRVRVFVDPIAIAGVIVAVVMLILMVVGVNQLKAAQAEAAAMERYVAQLLEENETLREAYDSGYDLETIERLARALGMVPKEDVDLVQIRLPEEPEVIEPTFWERVCAFFTDLFA